MRAAGGWVIGLNSVVMSGLTEKVRFEKGGGKRFRQADSWGKGV